MYCPVCHDEFREGFTRCEDCDADLVADLDAKPAPDGSNPSGASVADPGRAPAPIQMSPYCGFLTLEDAREARDLLRSHRVLSEIVIREAPGGDPEGELVEEFWLGVDVNKRREAGQVLEMDDDDDDDEADASGGSDPFRM